MDSIYTQLCRDHQNMHRVLDTFEELLADMTREDRDPATLSLLLDTLDYIATYPDKWHHPVEDVIFSVLLNKPDISPEPILWARDDHLQLAKQTKELKELLYAVAHDCAVDRDHLQAAADRYLKHQREHMTRENRTVFPLMEEFLTEQDWMAIGEELEERTDQVFNPAMRCQYDALQEYVNNSRSATAV